MFASKSKDDAKKLSQHFDLDNNKKILQNGLNWLQHKDLRNLYAGLTVPTTVYLGKQDRIIPVSLATMLRSLNHRAKVRIFDNAHDLPLTATEKIAGALHD